MAWSGSSALALLLLVWASPEVPLERFESAEPHMGTLFRITLYASDAVIAQKAFRVAFDRVHALDEILSDYNPQSELMRVCATAHRGPVPVSVDLYRVLAASQKLAEETDGAFDVTFAPVIRLWREARKQRLLPDPAALAKARASCGYRNLVLDAAKRTVFLKSNDMLLDLGGIAKGYAADAAQEVLRSHGITRVLVAASGDLAIGDSPPGKTGWRVGVDAADSPDARFTRVLILHNVAVSTSGDSEQFLEVGGVRYSHIIDPHTGVALTTRIVVTIVGAHGIETDGLATAVSVLGAARGMDFVEHQTSAAAMVVQDERGIESVKFRKLPRAE